MARALRVTRAEKERTRAFLAEHYPAAFRPKGDHAKQPLKIGIYNDIKARHPEIARHVLHGALGDYTAGPSYLLVMVAGAQRVGLMGEPAGTVSKQHEAEARARLMGDRYKLWRERTGWTA
jgi:ProP effector